MTYKKRLITAIATGAVLLNALAPLALADTLTVTGNGALSNNTANLSNSVNTTVAQTNSANITNNVKTSSDTGNNSASFNTGGQTAIVTGNSTSDVNVSTAANLNKVTVDPCACDGGNTTVNISGNGAESANNANVNKTNDVVVAQTNDANINNNVDTKANTGNNDAAFNTGGNTIVKTGDASSNVTVSNAANANVAQVGGASASTGSDSSVKIAGNGALSDNYASLNNNSAVVVAQANQAAVDNHISTKEVTGNNSADYSTGGTTYINTGNASSNVGVDNLVNFNAADVSCGCVIGGGTDLKIGANGALSYNSLSADNNNNLGVANTNYADLLNNLQSKQQTGTNAVSFSTGSVYGDPTVFTGDSNASTDVTNTGNVNLVNQGASLTLPGGLNLGVSFDLNGLMGGLFGWM